MLAVPWIALLLLAGSPRGEVAAAGGPTCAVGADAAVECRMADGTPLAAGRLLVRQAGGATRPAAGVEPAGGGARLVRWAGEASGPTVQVDERAGVVEWTVGALPAGAEAVCLELASAVPAGWRAQLALLEHADAALAALGTAGFALGPGATDRQLHACVASGAGDGRQRLTLLVGRPDDVARAARAFRPALAVDRPAAVVPKDAPAAAAGYLFLDLTQANARDAIAVARDAGFPLVLVYASTWAGSYGSYPVNRRTYPEGEDGLRRVVRLAREHGVGVGLHVLTSLVSKHDPLVRAAPPDPRLLIDDRSALAADVSAAATTLPAGTDLATFPSEGAFYGNRKAGIDLRVGDEIVRCPVVVRGAGAHFASCRRGVEGTRAVAHAAGTPILHLAERYGAYLADLRTTLKDDVAARIAGVADAVGADMLYFDAGEVNAANGPAAYWVAEQQIAVLGRLRSPVLVEGSGLVPRLWPFLTRVVADDFAALAPAAYLDAHKIGRVMAAYARNRTPGQLGWIGLLPATPAHPPTVPEDLATHVARALALDVPFSVETRLASIRDNPYRERLLRVMRAGNAVLGRGVLPAGARERLRAGEWTLLDGPVPALGRIERTVRRVEGGGEPVTLAAVPPGTTALLLRIGDVSASRPEPGVVLAGRDAPVTLSEGDVHDGNRGAAAVRIPLGSGGGLDLTTRRRMAVEYALDDAGAEPPCAVLNLQLEDGRRMYRDYFVDLRGEGTQRALVEPGASAERMLRELTPAAAEYAFKAAVYQFDFGDVRALTARWMRTCRPGRRVRVDRVAMLDERPGALEAVELQVGEARHPLAERLATGEVLEVAADGSVAVCRGSSCAPSGRVVAPGAFREGDAIVLRARGDAGGTVTVMPVVERVAVSPDDAGER